MVQGSASVTIAASGHASKSTRVDSGNMPPSGQLLQQLRLASPSAALTPPNAGVLQQGVQVPSSDQANYCS